MLHYSCHLRNFVKKKKVHFTLDYHSTTDKPSVVHDLHLLMHQAECSTILVILGIVCHIV